MPENVHFCIQKAATHSHFIQLKLFLYLSVAGIEELPEHVRSFMWVALRAEIGRLD